MKIETIDGFRIAWIALGDLGYAKEAVHANEIDGIGLNPYSGWDGTPDDINRLPTRVRAMAVPFGDRVGFSQQCLDRFTNLEFLWVGESKERWKVSLRDLRVLRLQFDRNIVFGELPRLGLLGAFRLDKRWTAAKMPRAPSLERFEANQGNCSSLSSISGYRRLRAVNIANLRKLESIEDLAELSTLEFLRIESCKVIKDLEKVISSLSGLKTLQLIDCGELDSLAFVAGLELNEFLFGRTVVRNGDLSVLDRIGTVAFDDQPHYNRRAEDMLPTRLR